MEMNSDLFYNLAERVDDFLDDIKIEICANLRNTNEKYADMHNETIKLQEEYPIIPEFIQGVYKCEYNLSVEERAALFRCLMLITDMEYIESKHIFIRGYMDCISNLKHIGTI